MKKQQHHAGKSRQGPTLDVPRGAPRSHAAYAFDCQSVEPGTRLRHELPVARLPTGSWLSLPVVVLHGVSPGPTIWLSGAVHGDELNGVIVVDEVVRRIDVRRLAGTVLAVPVVNGFGLIQGSRYMPDRRDLNRCFPGSRRGSLGARLAQLLSEQVIARADVGIDFHSGSGGRINLPHVRCDLDHEPTRKLAFAFGAPVALHASTRDGSLRAHASKLGKTVLLYEGGEAHRLDDEAIEVGVDGTFRVMKRLGMLDASVATPKERRPRALRSSSWIRASRSGFCRLRSSLGEMVREGSVVGQLIDPATGSRTDVRATRAGMIIALAADSLVTAGDALLHVAETTPRPS